MEGVEEKEEETLIGSSLCTLFDRCLPQLQVMVSQHVVLVDELLAASPSKQRVHVTISDQEEASVDEEQANAVEAIASTKATHRVSLSGKNVHYRARSCYSSRYLGSNGGRRSPSSGVPQASRGGNARKSVSFTPMVSRGCGGTGGADKASITLNLPNGSSVIRSFPASAYLDEVRWFTEELLATVIPSCFPFTVARTIPLREFSREAYHKTLEHLAPSATLLVLPRSAAQGDGGVPALISSGLNDKPVWVTIFRLAFGMIVATPLSLIWNLLNRRQTDPAMAATPAAFLSGSQGSSTLSTLSPFAIATVATPLCSGGRLCRLMPSSHTENSDIV